MYVSQLLKIIGSLDASAEENSENESGATVKDDMYHWLRYPFSCSGFQKNTGPS